ncbi:transcriptional regulator [Enterococcus casseliflavus]|nr:transcriptional regulator [Enterococcus casseliflavus]
MLNNLEEVRKEKNISLVDMADLLGVRYQTIREKISGDSDFKFGEALAIQEKFFPEYEIKFLFTQKKEDDTKGAASDKQLA